jgi:hypothetical protein
MGSLVLQGLVDHATDGLPDNLFDTIVIGSAASAQDKHKAWIENIRFGTQLFITANKNDKALRCLESDMDGFGPSRLFCSKFKLPPRLGRWSVAEADNNNTSTNARYVGFTNQVGKTHRYYINQKDSAPGVFSFYRQVFQGEPVGLANYEEVIPNRVYKLR